MVGVVSRRVGSDASSVSGPNSGFCLILGLIERGALQWVIGAPY